jgi:hypothetical protein
MNMQNAKTVAQHGGFKVGAGLVKGLVAWSDVIHESTSFWCEWPVFVTD